MNEDRLFNVLIALAVGIVVYVIVVGGIVCVRDPGYYFAEYLTDIAQVVGYLFAAIAAVVFRSVASARRRNGRDRDDPPRR